MNNSDLEQFIEEQIKAKAIELSTWKQVRWEGGRLYFETTKIATEIKEYNTEIKILYLEKLLNKDYVIQDNWPHSVPDITEEFKIWLRKSIAQLKILKLQTSNNPKANKKIRAQIPGKTKALLQKEISSKCPFCPSEDVDHFQIHHIDENKMNNQYDNLLMLCPTCHSKITKKNISFEQVISVKQKLIK